MGLLHIYLQEVHSIMTVDSFSFMVWPMLSLTYMTKKILVIMFRPFWLNCSELILNYLLSNNLIDSDCLLLNIQ